MGGGGSKGKYMEQTKDINFDDDEVKKKFEHENNRLQDKGNDIFVLEEKDFGLKLTRRVTINLKLGEINVHQFTKKKNPKLVVKIPFEQIRSVTSDNSKQPMYAGVFESWINVNFEHPDMGRAEICIYKHDSAKHVKEILKSVNNKVQEYIRRIGMTNKKHVNDGEIPEIVDMVPGMKSNISNFGVKDEYEPDDY